MQSRPQAGACAAQRTWGALPCAWGCAGAGAGPLPPQLTKRAARCCACVCVCAVVCVCDCRDQPGAWAARGRRRHARHAALLLAAAARPQLRAAAAATAAARAAGAAAAGAVGHDRGGVPCRGAIAPDRSAGALPAVVRHARRRHGLHVSCVDRVGCVARWSSTCGGRGGVPGHRAALSVGREGARLRGPGEPQGKWIEPGGRIEGCVVAPLGSLLRCPQAHRAAPRGWPGPAAQPLQPWRRRRPPGVCRRGSPRRRPCP